MALSHRLDVNDVYSNSWGPSDNGEIFEAPGPLAQEALERSIREVHTVQSNQSSISYDKLTCSTVYNLLYDLIMFVNCKEKDWTTGNVLKVLSMYLCTRFDALSRVQTRVMRFICMVTPGVISNRHILSINSVACQSRVS